MIISRGLKILNKDLLKDYQGLLLEEKQLQEQLEIWEAKMVSVGGGLDGMPHGSGTSDPTSRYAVKIAEINENLALKRIEIAEAYQNIETSIEGLERSIYRYIMREYYLNDNSWEQIAVKANYSIQRIWQMHGEALKNIRVY